MRDQPRFLPLGDSALTIEFGNKISPEINKKVNQAAALIQEKNINNIIEIVPTYCSLTIYYNPCHLTYNELIKHIESLDFSSVKTVNQKKNVVTIPVVYGGEFGPDLKYVEEYTKLPKNEIISIHSSCDYLVYMLGFLPGFPYLGGMNKKITVPRMAKPRLSVPAGSIGIGGEQTGIYPLQSPGGWQLIGRTPLKLFDINRDKPFLLKAGDYIRFKTITETQFRQYELD
ncbi:MAG TPA: allophanate hydrolase [Lentisphaeria bacterium]|nr:MAG: allophanate hydrolase [Lentisphaerae bacterium GWF2_38_69]HBM15596.1 allophanate hydrolase [Lentisphaeria bacterium]